MTTKTKATITFLVVCSLHNSAVLYAQRTLLRESFEKPSIGRWKHTWGEANVSEDYAQDGKRSLKCTVENKYGMSVHHRDFKARAGATYTLTGYVYIPEETKECYPTLRLCAPDWTPVLADASRQKKGSWVQLKCQWRNEQNLRTIRVALHNSPWKEGLGGAAYYWDNIVLIEEGGAMTKAGCRGKNPNVIEGLEVTPAGGIKIAVSAGKASVLGKVVEVAAATLDIAAQRTLSVVDEPLHLTDDQPKGWGKGTPLKHARSLGTTLPGCLEPGSIVVKEKPGDKGVIYEKGKDWRADETWGRIGRFPDGAIKADQTVYVDYRIRLMRVDTICVDSTGKLYVRQGDSQKMCPEIPRPDYDSLDLCNVYLPYGCKEITQAEIYPIGEAYPEPDVDFIEAHRARVAKTRGKLERGEDVTIVAWGDSVTCGGDATGPEHTFVGAFAQALRFKYPDARVKMVNAGRGGWNSNMSLPLFEDDVLREKPDLVIIEYVNDMGMTEENMRKNYFNAVDRIREIGGEVVIITPHFTMPRWMKHNGLGTPETRPQVGYLRKICEEKKVAIADASKRWEHLVAEGIPYYIYLRNGINHPNDAGHQLFVDELMRLF